MPISFNQIPDALRTPGAYIEFEPRGANLSDLKRVILVGAKSGGTADTGVITPLSSADDAMSKFGTASTLAAMTRVFKAHNTTLDLYGFAVTDSAAPDLAELITAMGEQQYHYIVNPYTDADNLALLKVEMDDRWHALNQIDGRVFMVGTGTYDAVRTFGQTYNSPHFSTLGIFDSSQPAHEALALFAAISTYYLDIDPARPLQDLELPGMVAGSIQPTREQRNTLLFSGISTFKVGFDGTCILERVITMYQKNIHGFADDAYLDINVPEILSRMRQIQRYTILSKFSRFKLAKTADKYGAGQKIVTPAMIKAELLTLYEQDFMGARGWVQDYDYYKDNLVVEIAPHDPDRVQYRDEPTLIGQFRILAGQVAFKS